MIYEDEEFYPIDTQELNIKIPTKKVKKIKDDIDEYEISDEELEKDYKSLPKFNKENKESKAKKKSKVIIVTNTPKTKTIIEESVIEEPVIVEASIKVKKQKESKQKKKPKKTLKIIPLGGLEDIGMNMTAFEYDDSIIVVDCGIAFPDDVEQPGIEAIIPNVQYLRDNINKVKGFVVTHGHEDHIGAFPYILPQLNVPVYGTPLTIGLINKKLEESPIRDMVTTNIVNFGDEITLGDIKIEFIKTNHSIVDAAALAIKTKIGTIIHTGDFKVDYTPVYDDAIDLARFARLGESGVLAMLCDSTNAERPGFTPSERKVAPALESIFRENVDNRIIVATFASNVDRVQQIINIAYKYNRKVLLDGRSMVNIISIANELGKIQLPPNTIITEDEMNNFEDKQLCIIATGSQGENAAALSRMANGTHKKIKIDSHDTIVLSSHPIPGNEKSISYIINNLEMLGATVVPQDTHVSGHACQEELKLIYSLVKPKFAVPIHGEYKHRIAGGNVAMETGVEKENVIILKSGDVLEFDNKGNYYLDDTVEHGEVMIDGYSKNIVENVVINDRIKLANSGFINAIYVVETDNKSSMYLNNVKIVTRGFVKVNNSYELLDEIKEKAITAISKKANKNGIIPLNVSVSDIQDTLSDFVFEKTRKRPMIVVTIVPIENN